MEQIISKNRRISIQPNEEYERNKTIYELKQAGYTYRQIVKELIKLGYTNELSTQRVQQLFHRYEDKYIKNLFKGVIRK